MPGALEQSQGFKMSEENGRPPDARLDRGDLFRIVVAGCCVVTVVTCAICATILGVNKIDPPPGLVGIAATALGIIAGMASRVPGDKK